MRRQRARESRITRAKQIYSEEGVIPLLIKGYKEVAPRFLSFRYGAARTLSNPAVFGGHLKQYLFRPANELYHKHMSEQVGENVMEKDWDTLILLDACRYDIFEEMLSAEGDERISLDGELDSVTSLGSVSPAFMKENFSENTFHDVVYITANSYAAEYADGIFHDVIDLWDDGWDEELQAVSPDFVTEAASNAHTKYPNKRLLIHYMQPHDPWIGDKGREFIERNGLRDENSKEPEKNTIDTYSAINHNLINYTVEEMVEIYKENVQAVVESLKPLLSKIEGKTVITADHGELLGENEHPIPISMYGHCEIPTDELRHVPWFVIEGNSRREIITEEPTETNSIDTEIADERLKALGYK